MKLFFWDRPRPTGDPSIFFAVAESVEEAKRLVRSAPRYDFGIYLQDPADYDPEVELGEPTRVLDLPCAEWHEWSE